MLLAMDQEQSSNRISRAKAKSLGLKKYLPLKPCANGHDALRRVSGPCVVCERQSRIRWEAANPTIAARNSAAAWARKNPERHRANSQRWQKNNIWYATLATNRRRARKASAEGHYSKDDVSGLIERQCGRCAGCGSAKKLEVDHIVPLSKGGTNWPSNLQMLCRSCNAKKGSTLPAC